VIQQFLRLETLAGLFLGLTATLAIVLANSPLAESYQAWVETPFEIRLGTFDLTKPLLLWINDGLMAVFFLLVALELKREVLEGELSSAAKIALPLAGAIGGILVPAAVFYFLNSGDADAARGWAIPCATDIAFALGILSLLGDRVPPALKTFLLSLAVFDDIGAILIIAAFYTEEIDWVAKGLGLAGFAALVLMNRLGVKRYGLYFLVGAFMWVCVLKSGMHATLAGVLVGLTIPLRGRREGDPSPLRTVEHMLHPWVAFLILPVFAFANAGVVLADVTFATMLEPVSLGILLGLFGGKLVGVYGAVLLMTTLGLAKVPTGVNRMALLGVCLLSGIGFTMSLFIGTLAYESNWIEMGVRVRLGVLAASILSAVVGFLVLRVALRTRPVT
jgi:Na+:H+ antiporter, NhaA family